MENIKETLSDELHSQINKGFCVNKIQLASQAFNKFEYQLFRSLINQITLQLVVTTNHLKTQLKRM